MAVCALRLGQRRSRVLDVGARPLDLGLLVEHGRAGRLQVGPRLVDLGLEDLGVDAGDDLVFFTTELKSTRSSLIWPETWLPDLDGDDGVEVAGGGDGGGEGAALDGGRRGTCGALPRLCV